MAKYEDYWDKQLLEEGYLFQGQSLVGGCVCLLRSDDEGLQLHLISVVPYEKVKRIMKSLFQALKATQLMFSVEYC